MSSSSSPPLSQLDQIVGEYLIFRGLITTFKALEAERIKERNAKLFDVKKLVETLFSYIHTYEIESFVNIWDFLSKRFFLHLDSETYKLASVLKSDLLKYYLVHAVKQRALGRVSDFFLSYSHEILSEAGESIAGSLRSWFVLPYIEDPERDPEFSVYFTVRWADSLRLTVTNFLSIVIHSAPPPKLVLLERWFRAEAQQALRAELKQTTRLVDDKILHTLTYNTAHTTLTQKYTLHSLPYKT
jgi:hypothetical protein